jgi:hypothetical protein
MVTQPQVPGRATHDRWQPGTPRFQYRDDAVSSAQLSEFFPQCYLGAAQRQQVDSKIKRLADVCEVLSLAQTTRDILVKTGRDGGEKLVDHVNQLRLKTPQKMQHGLLWAHWTTWWCCCSSCWPRG